MCRALFRFNRVYALLLIAATVFSFLVDASEFVLTENDKNEAVSAATEPLIRELLILREKLDKAEALHDTFEAATEQFRIQARSLKEKLEQERAHYEHMASINFAKEERFMAQIQDLREELEGSVGRTESLERDLHESRSKEQLQEARYKEEIRLQLQRIDDLHERLRNESTHNAELRQKLEERDLDLKEAKLLYFDLRQQLFSANERLREVEVKLNENILSKIRDQIMTIDEVATVVHYLDKSLIWFNDEVSPLLCSRVAFMSKQIEAHVEDVSKSIFLVLSQFDGFENFCMRTKKFAEYVSREVSSTRVVAASHGWYQAMHVIAFNQLNSLFDIVSQFCILQEGPAPTSWLYRTAILAKHHCISILLWIEKGFTLLVAYFAVKLTKRWRGGKNKEHLSKGSLLLKAKTNPRHHTL